MKVVRNVAALRDAIADAREHGRTIGFVPTMGALHDGHVSLLRASREHDDVVVLSIFVNPLQFGTGEDLSSYPRDEAGDLVLARTAGVDLVLIPTTEEMYPPDRSTTVTVGSVAEPLEGSARPDHFDGVATVVAKLFNLVTPDRAYFGQKDAQQVAVVKTMARDLSFPLDVVVCPTVREADGLALSSRNAYLRPQDRKAATALWRALQAGGDAIADGASWEVAEKTMEEVMGATEGVALEYARAVDPDSFQAPASHGGVLLVIAARVGRARLIDNLLVER